MIKLPSVLEKEPLVDAVFEVRMGGDPHLVDILPGVLFGQLDPKPRIERLPAAEIPKPIRSADANLAFAPLIRLDWQDFAISFGDRSLVVACKLPYPKWRRFKQAILSIIGKVASAEIVGPIERYSLKYVNLIESIEVSEQIKKINMAIKIGDVSVSDENLSLQVHRAEGDTLHIMSIITGAQGRLADGREIVGAVVDIDSIRMASFPNFSSFSEKLETNVETLRQENKVKFFSCLTEVTIQEMGPRYD